jgi:hypothetical protein
MIPTKAEIKAANTKAIEEAGLPFHSANNGECLCFREPMKLAADFYPSTGRWCFRLQPQDKKPITKDGGAEAFIEWYRKGKP